MAMDTDALIEQLAFGKATPKLSSCLGLYLSPEVIYLSETHMEKGKPVVDHLIRVPVPAPAIKPGQTSGGTSLNTDFLKDNEKLSALIRQAMSQIRWNSKQVVVTLSHHLGILRYFTMPAIDRRFWAASVPMEAKKYIPIPFDGLNNDFQIVDIPAVGEGKPRQGALIAVTPKSNFPNIKDLLDKLGLTLLGMEVAPCSVLRMWNSLEAGRAKTPYCQAHFDGGSVRIMVSDKGIPVFFREIFLGVEASVQESRKVDIGGCVNFSQKQLSVAKLGQVCVSGVAAELEKWREVFAQELGMPVAVQNTPALLGIKGGDWAGYASIGAALRYLTPSALTIDLGNTGRISEAEKRTAKDIFLVAMAVSALLIGIGLFRESVYKYRARDLAKFKRQPEIDAKFINKSSQDIELLLRAMQEQADLLRAADPGTRIKLSAILKEVVSAMPEKVWLTKISISNPIKAGVGAGAELQLQGHASGVSLVEEQDLAFSFRDKLAQSPLIGKIFPDLQVSGVNGKPMDPESLQGLEQDALKQKLEERTVFDIIGRGKKK